MEESDLLMKLESLELKRQVEVLSTFLPDQILNSPDVFHTASGVLLYVEVAGLSTLCERYNKVGEGGICPLTATLNAHAGIIVEIINFHGGDLLRYTGDEYLAYWKAESKLEEVIHDVIVCSLFIHDNYGCFETEVYAPLKLKLIVCYGGIELHVFGNANSKRVAVLGAAVEDIKFAKTITSSGEVMVSPEAWKLLRPENYEAMKTTEGFVKVWNCVYDREGGESKAPKDDYGQKETVLETLCSKHLDHRRNLCRKERFGDTTTQLEVTESFVRLLPARPAVNAATKRWKIHDLKPFAHRIVQGQIDEAQAVEDLTEMRELTVEYIKLDVAGIDNRVFTMVLQKICAVVEDVTAPRFGVLHDVSLLDEDLAVTVLFGLRRRKHELESKNALESAFKVQRILGGTANIKSISIGVSTGSIYTGTVGHPLRRDFLVIGRTANRAERLAGFFPNKITCDYRTYRNSKLSSHYFHLLCVPSAFISCNVFEYGENFKEPAIKDDAIRIVGREEERDLVRDVINHPEKVSYYGICLHGRDKIGKSTLMRSSMSECQRDGYAFASIELCRNTQRPYFCVSNLYKQLYNRRSRVDSEEFVLIKDLPSELWDFGDVLQRTADATGAIRIQRKFKMLNSFREITRNSNLGFAVIFIDNIQYIDAHSLDILGTVAKEKCVRLVCAGQFDEDFWNVRWKISLNDYIKLFELGPLKFEHLLRFVCSGLKVQGAHVRLMKVLKDHCDSVPGLMEEFLCELSDGGHLQTLYVSKSTNLGEFVFLNAHEIKRGGNKMTGRKLVCRLSDDFACREKISAASLSAHALENYNSFHLDLLKVSSALGEIFSRSLLSVVFKYPSRFVFADAVRHFFHREIFECATRFLSSSSSSSIGLVAASSNFCLCAIDESEREQSKAFSRLPKYAFCKLLRFKNKIMREIAYERLGEEEKRKLNLRVTDILEEQNNSCGNCLRNGSAPIVLVPKFREIFLMCNVTNGMNSESSCNAPNESGDIENVMSKCAGRTFFRGKKEAAGLKRNIWDSSICYCLEILIKVYQDLVYHSKEAGHVEKVIFFLVQNAKITMLMNEFQDATPILEEAMELCKNHTNTSDVVISQTFRSVHEAKINALLSEIYLNLGATGESRRYLLESFKQYRISLVRQNVFTRFFGIPIFKSASDNIGSKSVAFRSDFGACLNLASSLFAAEGDWNLAKIASAQCVNFMNKDHVSLNLLCDVYSNAIGVYNYCGETARCDKLEKYVSQHVLKKFNSNVTLDLFSVSKLIFTVFQVRFLNAKIEMAIRLGFRAVDLNTNIQANYVLVDVAMILSSALSLAKRIEDSVEVAKLLYDVGKIKQDRALLAYHTCNLELALETSFTVEPIEKSLDFAEDHVKILNGKELTALEKSLFILTYVYHLRSNRWVDFHKWRAIVNSFEEFPCTSVQTAKNLFRYTEALMIFFVKNDMSKRYNLNSDLGRIKTCLKQCKTVAKKWRVFKPRCLHYQAYYCRIMERIGPVKRYLKRASAIAEEQGNILERCWVMQSENFWEGGFSFEGSRTYVDWKQVKSYSPLHWSQILYGLPWHP